MLKKIQNCTENDSMKFMGEGTKQSMYLFKTNPNEVKKLISKLNNKKSSGFDELSAKFIKLCSPYISDPLSKIFNKSIYLMVFTQTY